MNWARIISLAAGTERGSCQAAHVRTVSTWGPALVLTSPTAMQESIYKSPSASLIDLDPGQGSGVAPLKMRLFCGGVCSVVMTEEV